MVNGFNGNIRNPGQAFAYFGVGAVSGAAGAAAFQGMNNLLDKTINFTIGRFTLEGQPFKIFPTNTLSYIAGSTVSQVTANLVNGRNPFKGVDYGFNFGLLLPLSIDMARYSYSFNMHIAKKAYPNYEIVHISSETTLMSNGNLRLDQNIGIQEYYDDFRMEFTSGSFLTGKPRPHPRYFDHQPIIVPNYTRYIFSLFNSLLLYGK